MSLAWTHGNLWDKQTLYTFITLFKFPLAEAVTLHTTDITCIIACTAIAFILPRVMIRVTADFFEHEEKMTTFSSFIKFSFFPKLLTLFWLRAWCTCIIIWWKLLALRVEGLIHAVLLPC